MSYNYRELVEALEDIASQEEEVVASEEGFSAEKPAPEVAVELLKSISECLIGVVDKIKAGEDQEKVVETLQKACDILSDLQYTDESTEEVEECYGTEDMAPTIDKDGVQNYKVKDAPSYAARQGFVGM